LIERVLANLYLHAIQALDTRGGGAIGTRIRLEADRVTFAVDDDGPGIAADAMDRVFDPLFTTKEIGTGLGLALCREVVRVHGGEISATSPPTGGATFSFWIPS